MSGQTAPWPELKRPLVAILRGLKTAEALDVGQALVDAGFEAIEVPLNSPDPFATIEKLAHTFGEQCLIGAGTVLTTNDVSRLADAGGKLLVSPNIDSAVMEAAARNKMVTMPGVFTATEALQAVACGATALKFFPANVLGPDGIKAIRAILPKDTIVGAVGGVSHADFANYLSVGVGAFGLGSSLYKPGMDAGEVARRAATAIAAYDEAWNDSV